MQKRHKKGLLSYCQNEENQKQAQERQQKVVCISAFSCNTSLKLDCTASLKLLRWLVTAVTGTSYIPIQFAVLSPFK